MVHIVRAGVLLAGALVCACAGAGDRVYIQVLGIAQDAGYPQAGCYQPHCMRAWKDKNLRRLTSSIALVDETRNTKYLFDATPDIKEQLYQLHRSAPDEKFALGGVFLSHAHIGHYTGLMHFGHEAMGSRDVAVFAMPRMHDFLSSNGPWSQLVRYRNIRLVPLTDGDATTLAKSLSVTPFIVPHRDEYSETVGFRIQSSDKSAVFVPDIDKWDRFETDIGDVVRSVDYALLDATFFDDGELPGRDMSKIPHPFVAHTMARLADLSADEKSRVIFIHMNHSNPLLIDGSSAQLEVTRRGFRFAREGMQLDLNVRR